MKTASYLVALIHSHVRASPPMPTAEVRDLKLAVAELSSVKRTFDILQLGHQR